MLFVRLQTASAAMMAGVQAVQRICRQFSACSGYQTGPQTACQTSGERFCQMKKKMQLANRNLIVS